MSPTMQWCEKKVLRKLALQTCMELKSTNQKYPVCGVYLDVLQQKGKNRNCRPRFYSGGNTDLRKSRNELAKIHL